MQLAAVAQASSELDDTPAILLSLRALNASLPMDPVSFAISVAQAADLCFHYARLLTETYKAFKHAEAAIQDRILHVARQCHVIHVQLDFMRRIEDSLSEEHKAIQTATLQAFSSRLKLVLSRLNGLIRDQSNESTDLTGIPVNKVKYVIFKSSLDEAIADLDRWQKDYDPSWFLMIKVASSQIDRDLDERIPQGFESSAQRAVLTSAKNIRDCSRDQPDHHVKVFLSEDGLRGAKFNSITYCSARYLQRPKSQKWLLVDRIKCSAFADPNLTIKDVRTLAAQLSNIDPERFGILKCYGIIKRYESDNKTLSSFDFVFEVPRAIEKEPRTLRSHLIQGTTHTLTKRFNTAMQLARSVCYVHTLGFVHKNIRPENVLSFPTNTEILSGFYLIGFDQARILERGTILAGDPDWEKDLYRHPDRQGLKPKETYSMQHDIYSLGVCLLEIGLWDTFLDYEADGKTAKATDMLAVPKDSGDKWQPLTLKDRLISLARDLLPLHMGERYADVVLNCLTCLDPDNIDFGNATEFQDEDGVLVGVRYIEKILLKLNSLRL